MQRLTLGLFTTVLALLNGSATHCPAQGLPSGGVAPPPPPQICPPSTPLILVLCTWPDRQGPTGPHRPQPAAANDHRFVSGGAPTPAGTVPPVPTCVPLTPGVSTVTGISNTRYIGPYVNASGYIEYPLTMSSEAVGVVSRWAAIEVSELVHDRPGSCAGTPGTVRVRVNGFDTAYVYSDETLTTPAFISGSSGAFTRTQVFVPIEHIRFPTQRGVNGGMPAPAYNVVELFYDTGTEVPATGCTPCVAVDWASIEFKCMSPIVMVHGNSLSGAWWDAYGFTSGLGQKYLPFDNSISFDPSAEATSINAQKLHEPASAGKLLDYSNQLLTRSVPDRCTW